MRHEEIAYSMGYGITEDGRAIGVTGKERKLQISASGYFRFSYRKDRPAIRVHRLQAYQKFGGRIYDAGMVVRHLDGNSKNNSYANIEIGTNQQNQMDRLSADRLAAAKHAASFLRGLTDDQVVAIREAYAAGVTGVALAAKYGTVKSTISEVVTGKLYAEVAGPIAQPRNRGRSAVCTGRGTA